MPEVTGTMTSPSGVDSAIPRAARALRTWVSVAVLTASGCPEKNRSRVVAGSPAEDSRARTSAWLNPDRSN